MHLSDEKCQVKFLIFLPSQQTFCVDSKVLNEECGGGLTCKSTSALTTEMIYLQQHLQVKKWLVKLINQANVYEEAIN